jgi:hypothetical protein
MTFNLKQSVIAPVRRGGRIEKTVNFNSVLNNPKQSYDWSTRQTDCFENGSLQLPQCLVNFLAMTFNLKQSVIAPVRRGGRIEMTVDSTSVLNNPKQNVIARIEKTVDFNSVLTNPKQSQKGCSNQTDCFSAAAARNDE